jgi:DNA polymerase III epsilon subunit-like protein
MYLVFDTETTGLPRDRNAPVTDLNNWPRLVQMAWLLFDASEKQIANHNYVVRPQGFTIPSAAARVHGITTEMALEEGDPLDDVLSKFEESLGEASVVIAHNLSFDEKILGAEFLRKGLVSDLSEKKRICTMKQSSDFCQLPGPYGYKWPTLPELHFCLFQETCEEIHDAGSDVRICSKCFFELKKRGVIKISTDSWP